MGGLIMKLFTYGELQRSDVQIKILGKEIPGIVDSISNWKVLNEFEDGATYFQLASQPSGVVFGKILELTDEQIEILDKYEKAYFRYTLKTDGGVEVNTYIKDNDKIDKNDIF
jgi:hypothetical protein